MSKRSYPRARRIQTALPVGVLSGVLSAYTVEVGGTPRLASSLELAVIGIGMWIAPGIGCDALVRGKSGATTRCGSTSCRWWKYQLRMGGVILGVRACSEHANLAKEEFMWEMSPARQEDFDVSEVMTT